MFKSKNMFVCVHEISTLKCVLFFKLGTQSSNERLWLYSKQKISKGHSTRLTLKYQRVLEKWERRVSNVDRQLKSAILS